MSLHISLDTLTWPAVLGQRTTTPPGADWTDVYTGQTGATVEAADTMPDPYKLTRQQQQAIDQASAEWPWLALAGLLVAGAAMVASHIWPWGVAP